MSAPRAEGDRFTLPDGVHFMPFEEQDDVGAADVSAFWVREAGLSEGERERRIHELVIVAVAADGALAGVSTAVVDQPLQLRLPLWHYRVFVAAAHRHRAVGLWLVRQSMRHHAELFAAGRDHRAAGIVSVMQNRSVERANPHADWWEIGLRFAGLDERGHRVRVHYFPGALAPDPPRPGKDRRRP